MDYSITPETFEQFRTLVYKESGISLSESKQSLVVARLSKRLRALNLTTVEEYFEAVTGDPSQDKFTRVLDLISTNKTDFFREPKHFDCLRDTVLPQLQDSRRIRIWSSACSSGEKPCTIAMTPLDSVFHPSQWDIKILTSDISTRVLAKAAAGLYDEDRLADVPSNITARHFLRGRGAHAGQVKVKPHLAELIRFRRLNLMGDRVI